MHLQHFDFKSSSYERPNQDWVCGKLELGQPCSRGPTGAGKCRGGDECQPGKRGSRWYCSRAEQAGGRCSEGPLPDGKCARPVISCLPKRSVKKLRRTVTYLCIVVVFAFVMGAMNISEDTFSAFINPGPLSASHSGKMDCKSCHGTKVNNFSSLLSAAVHVAPQSALEKNCKFCHSPIGELSAHDLPEGTLNKIDKDKSSNKIKSIRFGSSDMVSLARSAGISPHPDSGTQCLSCHSEHNGKNADVAEVEAAVCSRCHQSTFFGISAGHPEFKAYPHNRLARISFKHKKHFEKYFSSVTPAVKMECRECHIQDAEEGKSRLVKFEKSCGACHGSSLKNMSVMLLSIPGFDIDALVALGANIGEWPKDVEVEEVSPLLEVLLSENKVFSDTLKYIRDQEIDLLDLADVPKPTIERIEALAWAIKGVVYDLQNKGPVAVFSPLISKINGNSEINKAIQEMVNIFPMESIRLLSNVSFPTLGPELISFRNDKMRSPTKSTRSPLPIDDGLRSGWKLSDGRLSLMFDGHTDNSAMRIITEFALNVPKIVNSKSTKVLKTALAEPESPGACTSCHSTMKSTDTKAPQTTWHGLSENLKSDLGLTKFRHKPHLTGNEASCNQCHALNPENKSSQDFTQLSPKTCATCHTPDQAGDTCTDCHLYHSTSVFAVTPK
jgi:predicted CXXCH cytochrome family protein